jgi:predicted nucleic acid-binding protein
LDIFVDTGIVIGYSDISDTTFHEPCKTFVERHKLGSNGYYSNLRVINEEIRTKELERRKIKPQRVMRRFTQRAKIFIDHLRDASYETHKDFMTIYTDLHTFLLSVKNDLKRKEHDAILLTSAHLWGCLETNLVESHFLTTDYGDIVRNKDEIQRRVNLYLPTATKLKIKYILEPL